MSQSLYYWKKKRDLIRWDFQFIASINCQSSIFDNYFMLLERRHF